jgi:hypothetical protein
LGAAGEAVDRHVDLAEHRRVGLSGRDVVDGLVDADAGQTSMRHLREQAAIDVMVGQELAVGAGHQAASATAMMARNAGLVEGTSVKGLPAAIAASGSPRTPTAAATTM